MGVMCNTYLGQLVWQLTIRDLGLVCTSYISPFSSGLPPAGFPQKKTQGHQEYNTSGQSRFQAYDLSTERYARQCILIVLLKLGLFGLQVLQGANLLWDGKTATFGSSLYSVMEQQKRQGARPAERSASTSWNTSSREAKSKGHSGKPRFRKPTLHHLCHFTRISIMRRPKLRWILQS